MLPHADFHLVVRERADLLSRLRMRRDFKGDRKGRHAFVEAFGDRKDFVDVEAFFRRRAKDLDERNTTAQTATIRTRSVRARRDIFRRHDLRNFDTFLRRHHERHRRVALIPFVIQHDEDDSLIILEHAKRFDNFRSARSRKNIPDDRRVEHTFADKTAKSRLMARAAERHYRDLILRFRSRAYDDLFRNKLNLVRIAECVTLKKLVR